MANLNLHFDLKKALFGGFLSAAVILAGAWLVGRLSGAEARQLLEALLPNTRSICNTIILVCGTILALMLTLVGLTSSADLKLKDEHYLRVLRLAFLDAILLVFAMFVLLVLSVPIVESEKMTGGSYKALYWVTLASTSILGGAMITVVLVLYETIRDVITVIGMEASDHPLLSDEKNSED